MIVATDNDEDFENVMVLMVSVVVEAFVVLFELSTAFVASVFAEVYVLITVLGVSVEVSEEEFLRVESVVVEVFKCVASEVVEVSTFGSVLVKLKVTTVSEVEFVLTVSVVKYVSVLLPLDVVKISEYTIVIR